MTSMEVMRDATVGYIMQAVPTLSYVQACDAEIGVLNASISYAKQHGMVACWSNPHFARIYDNKSRSIVCNLDGSTYVQNTQLVDRITVNHELVPHDVALLPRDHVFPDRWSLVLSKKSQRDTYLSTARPVAMTDQYKCARCKKRECSYIELQTRSCDEPATLFIQCVPCGNRWRIG